MAGDDCFGPRWYFTRKEIEENSPSRKDGIDLKRETCLRKSYCQFLQELGMKLKVPQVTIATAMVFCHRFFLHQSHAKNDRKTIASVCMFLAGKSEETPRPLKDVIYVSYEIIYKKDPAALQKIKQKDVYEQQKELFLLGERLVLTTLGFDLIIAHSYSPLVDAIKKFNIAQNSLAQVAWNFVNDGLRTSLCLQFKPRQIAAGAIFLAAKFIKVRLPTEGEKAWWQEFDVTPRELEEVSNQLLELYEQNRVGQSSEANEVSTLTESSQGRSCRAAEVSTGGKNSTTPNAGDDPWGVAASKEIVGVTSSERNWVQYQNGWGRNMGGVGRDDPANPASYGSINTAESSSNRPRSSAEQQVGKWRLYQSGGSERELKRPRIEGHV